MSHVKANQAETLKEMVQTAQKRVINGWNARDDATRNMELSLADKTLELVITELRSIENRLEEMELMMAKATAEFSKQTKEKK